MKKRKVGDLYRRLAKQATAILGQHLPAAVWRIMAYWMKPNERFSGTELDLLLVERGDQPHRYNPN